MEKAVILAAGTGNRLKPLTESVPKCLIELSGVPLLDYSIKNLVSNDIKIIRVITGYKHDELKEYLNRRWKSILDVSYIYNSNFSSMNNIYSVFLAKEEMDDGTLLLNSDILYDNNILKYALKSSLDSFLLLDDFKILDSEEMKVLADENRKVLKLGKWIKPSESVGEYIGIMHLKGEERKKFFNQVEKMIDCGETDKYYEDALHKICPSINLKWVSTEGYPWIEIDTFEVQI